MISWLLEKNSGAGVHIDCPELSSLCIKSSGPHAMIYLTAELSLNYCRRLCDGRNFHALRIRRTLRKLANAADPHVRQR